MGSEKVQGCRGASPSLLLQLKGRVQVCTLTGTTTTLTLALRLPEARAWYIFWTSPLQ